MTSTCPEVDGPATVLPVGGLDEVLRALEEPGHVRGEPGVVAGHADVAVTQKVVQLETIDPTVAAVVRGLPSHGAVVTRVLKGSPAAKAGLVAATRQVTVNGVGALVGGDAIVSAGGKQVDSSAQLADRVALMKPGDKLTLQVVRDGAQRTVEVTLGTVPNGS